MGRLPEGPLEVRLAVTLFLLLIGLSNVFGALQVKNFASFRPRELAKIVSPTSSFESNGEGISESELPADLEALDEPPRHIERELLIQDSHVHLPAYALTAALLSLIVFGLRLSSSIRVILVFCAFAAPIIDFSGIWGAHLFPRFGVLFATVAIVGGFLMGAAYTVVLIVALWQCWGVERRRGGGSR